MLEQEREMLQRLESTWGVVGSVPPEKGNGYTDEGENAKSEMSKSTRREWDRSRCQF